MRLNMLLTFVSENERETIMTKCYFLGELIPFEDDTDLTLI